MKYPLYEIPPSHHRTRTREEYEAMAMLLGRKYEPETHVFYVLDEMDIDAETGEVLSVDDMSKRLYASLQDELGASRDDTLKRTGEPSKRLITHQMSHKERMERKDYGE